MEDEVEYILQEFDVTVDTPTVVPTAEDNSFEVTFDKNEFVAVGDNIYIPFVSADEAPWLIDLIDGQVTATYQGNLESLEQTTISLNQTIALAQNAQTAYENSIITSANITAAVETLRTELVGAEGTVTVALATKVTETQATAIANTAISASLDDGAINAKVGEINTAIADGDSANASRIGVVEATVNDPVSGVNAIAAGVTTLNTSVGIENGLPDGTGILGDLEILKKQNDGKVETYSNTYQILDSDNNIITTAEPYATWRASDVTGIDTRLSHIGDSYIEYVVLENGSKQYVASYKFIRSLVDNTSPDKTDSEGFTWALITDSATQEAYTLALNALELANGKITTFYQDSTNVPVAEGEGDIWIVSDEGNKQKRWNGLVWVNIQDAGILQAISDAQTAQGTADGKIESFYQPTAPTTASEGDLWFDTDDGNKIYTRRSGSWVNTQDSKIGTALLNAASAQATADGKITTFYQGSAPTGANTGDLWVDTSNANKLHRWGGASWAVIADTRITANAEAITDIEAYVTDPNTGTVGGGQSQVEQSITSKVSSAQTTIESKWAYDSTLRIGANYYRSGFGLKALATGGDGSEGNPYSSEFWVRADSFKIISSNINAPHKVPFEVDTTSGLITLTGDVRFKGLIDVQQDNVIQSSNGDGTSAIWAGSLYKGLSVVNQDSLDYYPAFALDVRLSDSTNVVPSSALRLRDNTGPTLLRVNPSPVNDDFKFTATWPGTIGAPSITIRIGVHVYDNPISSSFVLGFSGSSYSTIESKDFRFAGVSPTGTFSQLVNAVWTTMPASDTVEVAGIKFSRVSRYGTVLSSGGFTQVSLNVADFNQFGITNGLSHNGHIVVTVDYIADTGTSNTNDSDLQGSFIVSNF